MSESSGQAFFEQHGYYPTTFVPRKPSVDRTPVGSHAELTELIEQGQGFVFNNRADRKMLHQVTCESLEVMSTRAYKKFFFKDLDEAKNWLDKKYGVNGWVVCGRCRADSN